MPRDAAVSASHASQKPSDAQASRLIIDLTIERGNAKLDATFSVSPGVTVLVGRSGAGKSTLLDAIAGLFEPARGSIRVGSEIWFDSPTAVNLPAELRRVGIVLQSLALFPHMTALENVRYGLPKNGAHGSRDDEVKRARALLDRFHVGDLAERKPDRLSGGEAQRVAIARAVARDPHVLLLDEPFSALDVPLRDALAAEVTKHARDFSIPILVVTHDREDARRLGARVVAIASNRVVEESAPLRVDSLLPAS